MNFLVHISCFKLLAGKGERGAQPCKIMKEFILSWCRDKLRLLCSLLPLGKRGGHLIKKLNLKNLHYFQVTCAFFCFKAYRLLRIEVRLLKIFDLRIESINWKATLILLGQHHANLGATNGSYTALRV